MAAMQGGGAACCTSAGLSSPVTACAVPSSVAASPSKRRLPVAPRRGSGQAHTRVSFLSGIGRFKLRRSEIRAHGDATTATGREAAGELNMGQQRPPPPPQQQQQQEQQLLLATTGSAMWTPPVQSYFTDSHLLFLGFIACLMTGALSGVMLAAIPALLSMRKAADSLRRLADSARKDLPGAMAAVRMSGMEISDLTMELSDLGQEISAGVRNSSRAARVAEDGLRRLGTFTSVAVVQDKSNSEQVAVTQPAVAQVAKSTREALIQARNLVHSVMALTRLSSWFGRCWTFIRPWRQKALPPQAK